KAGDRHAFTHLRAERDRLAAKRVSRAKWIGRAVAARYDSAGAMVGDSRHQSLELVATNQLFVGEPAQPEIVDTVAKFIEFVGVLGDEHLAVTHESAIIVDEIDDVLPQRHREHRDRHLREVTRELATAARIDAG